MSQQDAPTPYHLEVRGLEYEIGGRQVFRNLSCGFPRGAVSVIAGASGAGKTTLLRMLAGLIRPDRGEIWLDWERDLARLSDAEIDRYRRLVGMLFQRGALLDAMSVFDNVALPLREHSGMSEEEIEREVREAFKAVGLENVDGLLPGELSGGMVKRVALARALIGRPDILFCDEPVSGLDPPTVRLVDDLLLDVNARVGATMIITSHHTQSTLHIADHIVMLFGGQAVSGTPEEILESRDPRVMEFFAAERGLLGRERG